MIAKRKRSSKFRKRAVALGLSVLRSVRQGAKHSLCNSPFFTYNLLARMVEVEL